MSSPQELIVKMKDFDAEQDVQYRDPRVNQRGGKNVSIVTGTGNKLVLQVPLSFTWGASEMVDETSGRRSYSVNFQPDKDSVTFKALQSFEEKIIRDAVVNSKKWFGQAKMSEEVIKALFYPILKYPKDKNTGDIDYSRDPTFKVKLPYWEDKFTMELYDMNNQVIYNKSMPEPESFDIMSELPPKSYMSCLIECGGVWFAGGRCGVTWKFLQGKRRKPVKLEGFCMLDDTDDEETEAALEEQDAAAVVEGGASVPEEETPPPTPASTPKKPRKKRVVKKTNDDDEIE